MQNRIRVDLKGEKMFTKRRCWFVCGKRLLELAKWTNKTAITKLVLLRRYIYIYAATQCNRLIHYRPYIRKKMLFLLLKCRCSCHICISSYLSRPFYSASTSRSYLYSYSDLCVHFASFFLNEKKDHFYTIGYLYVVVDVVVVFKRPTVFHSVYLFFLPFS